MGGSEDIPVPDLWNSHISLSLDLKESFLVHTALYFPEARIHSSFKVSVNREESPLFILLSLCFLPHSHSEPRT